MDLFAAKQLSSSYFPPPLFVQNRPAVNIIRCAPSIYKQIIFLKKNICNDKKIISNRIYIRFPFLCNFVCLVKCDTGSACTGIWSSVSSTVSWTGLSMVIGYLALPESTLDMWMTWNWGIILWSIIFSITFHENVSLSWWA